MNIASDDRGTGEPALLCLTGWCSSKERYAHLVPLLAEKRRTIAFDWRGHGESQRGVGDFGQDEMVEDALGVIEAAGIEQVVPVAASHSGWVAIELFRRLGPERVPKIVHMDWMVIRPSDPYMALLRSMATPEGWTEARDTLFRIWRAGCEAPEIDAVIDAMREQDGEMWMRSGREISAAYERNDSPLETYERMEAPPAGVLHLYGQPQDPAFFAAQQEFAAEHPWFHVERVPAETHFAMVETAREAAAAIAAFV
ncbi:MAG TPA: alpha/beta hydrolase [Gaiellaceae bacterium]|nr:alpha/beta hydrolase [Gaiellaceae bacterium]